MADIRPVNEDDLLGRHPADIDPVAVVELHHRPAGARHRSRRIDRQRAVPSAGRFEPAELFMLDRDESGLHVTQLSIEGRAMLDDAEPDPRRHPRLASGSTRCSRPAGPRSCSTPRRSSTCRCWRCIRARAGRPTSAARRTSSMPRRAHGVERFVNVSTDKAADPTSVLGWTKRITERLTAAGADAGPTECVSVRFGNVLGSNGSVLRRSRRRQRTVGRSR